MHRTCTRRACQRPSRQTLIAAPKSPLILFAGACVEALPVSGLSTSNAVAFRHCRTRFSQFSRATRLHGESVAHDALSSHSSADPFTPPADSTLWRQNFLLGAATASYQIEGAVNEDGRLPSIWDTFCATPGKVLAGDSGEVACDHYHRWEADVDMLAGLGLEGYRLSIAWPRVMHLDGTPNRKGLDFYKRLLARLKEKGITTFVTLYHWDLPQHLEDRGGWLNRETAYRFADYADLMSRELAGTVDAWATLNEPWCSAYLGYGNGHHAPGLANGRFATQAMHHLL